MTVVKDELSVKFIVDNQDALVDTASRDFDLIAPIYVGGVPRGFTSPTEILVGNHNDIVHT